MKRLVALLICMGVMLLPAAAQASHPTASFAQSSLRGQTANAPDNDIKYYWDWIESFCLNANGGHVDIVSSEYISSSFAFPELPHYRLVYWRFTKANGENWYRYFSAYWSGTTYHDDNYSTFRCGV
jgi:hypothetical protein